MPMSRIAFRALALAALLLSLPAVEACGPATQSAAIDKAVEDAGLKTDGEFHHYPHH